MCQILVKYSVTLEYMGACLAVRVLRVSPHKIPCTGMRTVLWLEPLTIAVLKLQSSGKPGEFHVQHKAQLGDTLECRILFFVTCPWQTSY